MTRPHAMGCIGEGRSPDHIPKCVCVSECVCGAVCVFVKGGEEGGGRLGD